MDTIYLHVDKQETKVSGGPDTTTTYVIQNRKSEEPVQQGGEVLDFEVCRRRLEAREALDALTKAPPLNDLEELLEDEDDFDGTEGFHFGAVGIGVVIALLAAAASIIALLSFG